MDQSQSDKTAAPQHAIQIPRRSFSLEFFVGLFTIMGVAAAGYLAVGLGDVEIGSGRYSVYAKFDNISGLKQGASVEIAGVPVGEVANIGLNDPVAVVTLRLDPNVQVRDDDIVSIRTKGIIGDRYVKISRGASDTLIPEGGTITETESVVDLEDVIGKIVHSLTDEKKSDDDNKE